MEDKRTAYALWLHTMPGVGIKAVENLLAYAKTEENIYFLKEADVKKLLKSAQAESFIKWKREKEPQREYERLRQKGICFYPRFHENYPEKLRQIPDSPYGVYVKGGLPEKAQKTVAIIGARACSEYGRAMAGYFASGMAKAGIAVISGLARGIDGIAQKKALEAGGDTYGVLGCGVDVCYPAEHADLYESVVKQGGILSEYPPGTPPRQGLFPRRNRIISGLSDLVLVVEARERSGTLITVDTALEQGRDVYAVPGRTTDTLSAGCNRLIRQGAGIAVSVEDLAWAVGMECSIANEKQEKPLPEDELERKIYHKIEIVPKSFSCIMEEIGGGEEPAEVMAALAELRIKGYVEEKAKNYYYRKC